MLILLQQNERKEKLHLVCIRCSDLMAIVCVNALKFDDFVLLLYAFDFARLTLCDLLNLLEANYCTRRMEFRDEKKQFKYHFTETEKRHRLNLGIVYSEFASNTDKDDVHKNPARNNNGKNKELDCIRFNVAWNLSLNRQ